MRNVCWPEGRPAAELQRRTTEAASTLLAVEADGGRPKRLIDM